MKRKKPVKAKKVRASVTGLSEEDVQMLLHSLSIAFEDGSIYGGAEEGEQEFDIIERRGDALAEKLRAALGKILRAKRAIP